jgi:hypothetical protein
MAAKKDSIKKDLGLSLVDTLASSDLSSVLDDHAEVIVDRILKDGLLKDIPIISTITGAAKTLIAVRDYLLVVKLVRFLQGINITEGERAHFEKSIGEDPQYRRTVGQNLLMLIDSLDDVTKADMVAKLFKAFLRDDITYNEFLRFASVVERAFIGDLNGFLSDWADHNRQGLYAKRLYKLGLAEITFETEPFLPDNAERGPVRQKASDPFFEPLNFKLSNEALVLAQIITRRTPGHFDYLDNYRKHRDHRKPWE